MPSGSAKPIFAAPGGVLKAIAAAGPMKAMAMTAAPIEPIAPPLRRPAPSRSVEDSPVTAVFVRWVI
jgi:hypothetical protein